jgi:glycosyltransferase involved in cell wall biosynthesis
LVERGYDVELISARVFCYDERIAAKPWKDRVKILRTDKNPSCTDDATLAGWKELFGAISSSVLIFPKGDYRQGSPQFLRVCRKKFRRIYFIEHLDADPLPDVGIRKLFGVIPLGLGLWRHKRRWPRILAARYAHRIVAVSNSVKNRLTHDWGIPRRKIEVVHNGVTWQNYRRDPAAGAAFRAKHGIPEAVFVFGMLTRLSYFKAVDVALRAIALLAENSSQRPFRLVLAGDGEDAPKLKALAAELNITSLVHFVGHTTEIRAALSSFDVILFSSRREGLPLALLEGMAAECIPIVTAVSGMPEAVDSDNVGRVVPVENAEALARAMGDILALDPQKLSQMRSASLTRITQHFDLLDCHRRLIQAFGL